MPLSSSTWLVHQYKFIRILWDDRCCYFKCVKVSWVLFWQNWMSPSQRNKNWQREKGKNDHDQIGWKDGWIIQSCTLGLQPLKSCTHPSSDICTLLLVHFWSWKLANVHSSLHSKLLVILDLWRLCCCEFDKPDFGFASITKLEFHHWRCTSCKMLDIVWCWENSIYFFAGIVVRYPRPRLSWWKKWTLCEIEV